MSSTLDGPEKLLTEKVDEECEMQVGDEPARERRNIIVPYETLVKSSPPSDIPVNDIIKYPRAGV
jgi:hypothetical protein